MPSEDIILLHAALGSKKQLGELKKLLSANFNVYDLDFEGHGEKSTENNFSIDLFAENVLDLIKKNKLKKTHIFGYSMGGYVALNLAKKHPQLIHKIVTFGTKFDWSMETVAKEVKMLDPNVIEAKVPHFAKALANTHGAENWKTVLQKTAGLMEGLAKEHKLERNDFKIIDTPALIVIGTLDRMVSIEESKNVAENLPNGRLEIIENFHHPIEKNDPNQLAKIITTFIQG